jgi:hypothetical protein
MRKLMVGSIALAIVGVAAIASATAGSSSPRHEAEVDGSATTVASTTTAASVRVTATSTSTSTSTTVPKPVDPLAGGAMLGWTTRDIKLYDANGNAIRTLVTAYADRVITSAQMMGDHHTIWYSETPDWSQPAIAPNQCNDIVRLDLATNTRSVIAHAYKFSVAGNGDRVVLSAVIPDAECSRDSYSETLGVSVVRDVSTGSQSTISGFDGYSDIAISPGGHVIATTTCTEGDGQCHISLRTAAIPNELGAPINLQPTNDQTLSFTSLAAHDDGLYAVVDPHPQSCGCGGQENRYDADVTVRRFPWSDLASSGTVLSTVQGPLTIDGAVIGPLGLFGWGSDNASSELGVYRLHPASADRLRGIANDARDLFITFGSLPEFAG